MRAPCEWFVGFIMLFLMRVRVRVRVLLVKVLYASYLLKAFFDFTDGARNCAPAGCKSGTSTPFCYCHDAVPTSFYYLSLGVFFC